MNFGIEAKAALNASLAGKAKEDSLLSQVKGGGQDREKVAELAQQFESIFINMMLQNMRKSVQKSDLLDGGNAEQIYRSMLDQEYATIMAQQERTGLAEAIERQLLQTMGQAKPAATAVNKSTGATAYGVGTLQPQGKQATIEDGTVKSPHQEKTYVNRSGR